VERKGKEFFYGGALLEEGPSDTLTFSFHPVVTVTKSVTKTRSFKVSFGIHVFQLTNFAYERGKRKDLAGVD
jgi:hypothetical protein